MVYFVPTETRAIALTIDDGVDPETTPLILEVLKAHNSTATFFLVSNSIEGNEYLIQQILAEGHEIGHHMTQDEVTVALEQEDLRQKFNVRPPTPWSSFQSHHLVSSRLGPLQRLGSGTHFGTRLPGRLGVGGTPGHPHCLSSRHGHLHQLDGGAGQRGGSA